MDPDDPPFVVPGRLHRALPDPDAVGEDEALATAIREEITQHGPITFARFMQRALYEPGHGYYRRAQAGPGLAGADFLTAPEAHPIFGAAVGRLVEEAWLAMGRPAPFTITEPGAGSGALAAGLLRGLRDLGSPLLPLVRYRPVEVEAARLDALRERLAADGLDDHLAGDGGSSHGPDDAGAVIANEVLDALPVHRVRQRDGRLMELAVTTDTAGQFREVEIEPTTSALQTRLAGESVELAEGQTAEICLALDAWIAEAAAPLARGLLLLIDYGAPAAQLYDPVRRRDGTLRAYVRHQVHDDPYRHVGRQDLTAHVDVTAVERAARAAGLATIGTTTQAEALMGLGIEERLRVIQADPATTFEAYTHLRSSLMRLLDPAAMGRFRVMAFGRDWDDDPAADPLRMFAYRLPTTR